MSLDDVIFVVVTLFTILGITGVVRYLSPNKSSSIVHVAGKTIAPATKPGEGDSVIGRQYATDNPLWAISQLDHIMATAREMGVVFDVFSSYNEHSVSISWRQHEDR